MLVEIEVDTPNHESVSLFFQYVKEEVILISLGLFYDPDFTDGHPDHLLRSATNPV